MGDLNRRWSIQLCFVCQKLVRRLSLVAQS
jgi:hypothetical protein